MAKLYVIFKSYMHITQAKVIFMKVIYKVYLGLFFTITLAIVQAVAEVKTDTKHIQKSESSNKSITKDAVKKDEQVKPRVKLETTFGEIVLELDPDKAPITVKNFLGYVEDGFYNDLIFHRVIKGFMVQGGGMKQDMSDKISNKPPIKNESNNGLSNNRASISMARTGDPDSATAQFFVNLVDNTFLNYNQGRPGYAVFGRVIEGMDIIDAIAEVNTVKRNHLSNVPEKNIIITKAKIIKNISNDINKSDKSKSNKVTDNKIS